MGDTQDKRLRTSISIKKYVYVRKRTFLMDRMCGVVILVLASAAELLPHQESGVNKAQ